MNKFITRLATLTLGLAMAAGVGVAVASNSKEASPVHAASGSEITSFSAISADFDTNISYASYKGGGTSNPQVNSNAIRLYQNNSTNAGGMLVVKAKSSTVKINSITIGSSMGTTLGVKVGTEYTTATAKTNFDSYALSANGKKTVSDLDTSVVTFACLGTSSSTRLYVNYLSVTYTASSNDYVGSLSVSPSTWSGYDSQTLSVSSFTVSGSKNGTAGAVTSSDYEYKGIGYMSGDNFVARDADFSSGNPTTADTRLAWKAKYPTTSGGSTYAWAYVTLTVSADSVNSIEISGSMTKTTYSQGDAWDPSGFTVNAYYASAPTTPKDVTSSVTWSYSPTTTASTDTKSVTCTASFGGQSDTSSAQSVTINEKSYTGGIVSGAKYVIVAESGVILPSAAEITSEPTQCASYTSSMKSDEDYCWTFTTTGVDDHWTITNSLGTSLKHAATNNGVRTSTSSATSDDFAASLTNDNVTVDGVSYTGIYLVANNRYLTQYTANTSWRCYTNANTNGTSKIALVPYEEPTTAATINGADSVVAGTSWSPTSVTEDVGGATVTGMEFSFAASDGASISSSNAQTGEFTSSSAGTVVVSATKQGYTIASKTVSVTSNTSYITLSKTETSGYTGQNEFISFTYGNLEGSLSITSSDTDVVTVEAPSTSGSSGTVQINFVGEGETTVKFKDGDIEKASLAVSVSLSEVTSITLDKATASLSVNGTTTLTATVVATGSASTTVSWSTGSASVATLSANSSASGSPITVTGAGLGTTTITATASDGKTATCTITVSLLHTYLFGTTSAASGTTNCSDLDATYNISPACFSGETTLYGSNNSTVYAVRMGSGNASGAFTYTLPDSGAYITKVILTMKAWSSSESSIVSVTPTDGTAVTQSFSVYDTWTEYEYTIPSAGQYTSVTVSTDSTNKRAYVASIAVEYVYKDPVITSDANNFEITESTSQTIDLTFTNYASTPTVTYEIRSGSSSVTSVTGYNSIDANNVAVVTIAASATDGSVVIRFTGTYGSQTTYIDIHFDVINPKTIESLVITTQGTTTFTEDNNFSVGPLVLTATFSDESTTVYSEANDNLGLLTFSPAIGTTLTTSHTSVTVYVTAYGSSVSQSYSITVNEKPYASLVSNVTDLWDGQEIYFASSATATKVGTKHAGGNNMGSANGVYVENKGLSINDTEDAQKYTIGRVKIDSVIYYTFSFVDNGKLYYLSDTGTSNSNSLGRTDTISDIAGNCIYFTISISDGAATITSKTNTSKPVLRWNGSSSIFACYQSGAQTAPYLFAVTPYDEEAVAGAFTERYLHMDENVSGQCNTYYPILKPVWAAMGAYEKAALTGEPYERLQAWAAAHGEHLDSNMNLVENTRIGLLNVVGGENTNTVAIIVIISVVSMTAIGGYFFLRKRKENI